MKISKNKVVLINYTLKDTSGAIIDTSEGRGPLAYIQGIGNLIPGMEEGLEGKEVGNKFNLEISPEKGYGPRYEEMTQVVESEMFGGVDHLEVGMQFNASGSQGQTIVTITEINGDKVTIDGNHPLAGETLFFAVEVLEIRDASKEELSHGHVHGPGGHHH